MRRVIHFLFLTFLSLFLLHATVYAETKGKVFFKDVTLTTSDSHLLLFAMLDNTSQHKLEEAESLAWNVAKRFGFDAPKMANAALGFILRGWQRPLCNFGVNAKMIAHHSRIPHSLMIGDYRMPEEYRRHCQRARYLGVRRYRHLIR